MSIRNQKMTLHNDEASLMSFFEKQCVFEIPIYQRSYKWNLKKITQVLNDFDELLEGEKSVHFFGAMIFYNIPSSPDKPSTFEVIDGQQRITTIFIFLLAYTYVLRKYSPEKAKRFFHQKIINTSSMGPNATLKPSKEDRGQLNWIFSQITKAKAFEDVLGDYTYSPFPTERNPKNKGPMMSNFRQFRKYLEEKIKKQTDVDKGAYLTNLVYQILNSCTAVSINIVERQNGPLIFDALNARQEPITVGELIKNAIFARMESNSLEEMDQLHNSFWVPFQENFILNNPKENSKKASTIDLLEGYFFPYSLIANPYIKKNEIYSSIVDSWSPQATPQQIVENLQYFQEPYIALNGGPRDMYPDEISQSIFRLNQVGIPRSTLPFFMQLLKRIEANPNFENEALKILERLESFLIRRAICGDANAGLHAIFKKMWPDLEKEVEINADNVMSFIKETKEIDIPNNNEFEKEIKEKEIYKNKELCRFILEEFDKSLGGEFPEDKDITIEHILPQKPGGKWRDQFSTEEHKQYVDVLGNLVLLALKSNIVLDNKTFLEKKELIKGKAKFKSTRDVFEKLDKWEPENVQERSSRIAKWAIKRWKPET